LQPPRVFRHPRPPPALPRARPHSPVRGRVSRETCVVSVAKYFVSWQHEAPCQTVHRGERHPPPVGLMALTLDMSPISPRGTSFAARSHDSRRAHWACSTFRTTASTTRSIPGKHSYPPHSVDFVDTFLAATGRAGPWGRSAPLEPIASLSITLRALGHGPRSGRPATCGPASFCRASLIPGPWRVAPRLDGGPEPSDPSSPQCCFDERSALPRSIPSARGMRERWGSSGVTGRSTMSFAPDVLAMVDVGEQRNASSPRPGHVGSSREHMRRPAQSTSRSTSASELARYRQVPA
jgi:hypothetical protein